MNDKIEKMYALSKMLVTLSDGSASIMLHGFKHTDLRQLPTSDWSITKEARDNSYYLVAKRGSLTLFSDNFQVDPVEMTIEEIAGVLDIDVSTLRIKD